MVLLHETPTVGMRENMGEATPMYVNTVAPADVLPTPAAPTEAEEDRSFSVNVRRAVVIDRFTYARNPRMFLGQRAVVAGRLITRSMLAGE